MLFTNEKSCLTGGFFHFIKLRVEPLPPDAQLYLYMQRRPVVSVLTLVASVRMYAHTAMPNVPTIKPRTTAFSIEPSVRYLVAFTALLFVLHELHEQAHTSVGRLLCGCWGPRDFNVWELCATCQATWMQSTALVAGPLFSYAIAWLGFYWLGQPNAQRKSLGFALVFGSVMQARLITAFMGGGDEVSLLRLLTGQPPVGRWLGLAITLVLATPPLWRAWQQLPRPRRLIYFLSFAFVPLLIEWLLVFKGLNGLLKQGVGAAPGLLGMPIMVTIWTIMMVIILALTYRWLLTLFVARNKVNALPV